MGKSWFPIANASLRFRVSAVHEWLFRSLVQTDGAPVVVSVGLFRDRLGRMTLPEADGGLGEEGTRAGEPLVRRGLTEAVVERAASLLTQLRTHAPEGPGAVAGEEQNAAAPKALWEWYLEWNEIARTAITDGRLLRALGFLRVGATGRGAERAREEPPARSADEPPSAPPEDEGS